MNLRFWAMGIALLGGVAAVTDVGAQCAPAPLAGCLRPSAPLASKVRFRIGPNPIVNAVNWDWTRGPQMPGAMLGSPETGTDNYSLCIYDTGALVSQLDMPASTTQWKRTASPKGDLLKYKGSPAVTSPPHGVRILTIANVGFNRAKIHLVALRNLVPVPPLAVTMPEAVAVQLVNTAGGCWEADYIAGVDTIYANTSATFKAKGE